LAFDRKPPAAPIGIANAAQPLPVDGVERGNIRAAIEAQHSMKVVRLSGFECYRSPRYEPAFDIQARRLVFGHLACPHPLFRWD
jgi:hypothetical protein